MGKKTTMLVALLLVFVCVGWSADKTWTGVISDSKCGLKHAAASDDAASCVAKCVSGGGKYVLVASGKMYQLNPQDKIESSFAGKAVEISGSLSGDTITVSSAKASAGNAKKTAGM